MESGCSGMKFMQLFLELLILNVVIFVVINYSPVQNYYMDLSRKDLYLLHANISEMIAFILYSGGNYFFRDKYIDRLKVISIRFFIFIVTLFLLAEILEPGLGHYSRVFLLEYAVLFYLTNIVLFYFLNKAIKVWHRNDSSINRVAILGANNSSQLLGDVLNNNPLLGCRFVGYVSDEEKDKTSSKILGGLNDLPTLTADYNINMIFVTDPMYFTVNNTKELLSLCNKVGLRVRYILMNDIWNDSIKKRIESEEFLKMCNPQEIPLDRLDRRIGKRLFDILFSLFVIIFIFSWLFPLVAILIKLESKGPVFFVQKRTGINNKTFNCLKFRTMKVNKESDTQQAQKNDSRITALGNILRKYNIDEFPQFINVLLGNMSVVGPRPHMLKHTDQYSALIDHYKVRHFVKPGVTGWAQVNGYRGLTDELWKMQKRVEYDMDYLERWDFLWDIKIIILTFLGKDAFKNAM